MLRKKIISCLLSLAMILSLNINFLSKAKAEDDWSKAQQLLDMVASAALNSEEVQGEVSTGNGLNALFAKNFVATAVRYTNDESLLTNNEAFLKDTLVAQFDNLTDIQVNKDAKYIGVKIITSKQVSENAIKVIGTIYTADNPINKLDSKELIRVNWLDRRLLVGLQKDDKSPYGYKVTEYSLHGELAMEKELNEYFEQHLVDYVNSKLGFSLQYPALFDEKTLQENTDGITADYDNGKAKMAIKSFANTDHWTAESFYKSKEANKDIYIQFNKEKNYVSVYSILDDNNIKFDLYVFNSENVFQITYIYDNDLAEDFGLYIQYLENTFTVLNGEIG